MDALGVGHNEQPVTHMWGTQRACGKHTPLRIKPEPGQVSENGVSPPNKESCDVLHEDVTGSNLANEPSKLKPQTGALTSQSGAESSLGDVLTGEASTEDVNGRDLRRRDGADVSVLGDVRPVLREDFDRVFVTFHLPADAHSCALQAQLEAANAAEERANG
jgi:hypothetical protein